MAHQVLVIEDDFDIAHSVMVHLQALGCQVKVAHTGTAGLQEAYGDSYDLIILDRILPEIEGLEICCQLRARSRYVPILKLSARSTILDLVAGLEMGADDYIAKPFSIHELTARVKALLRRIEAIQAQTAIRVSETIQMGDLVIDMAKRTVTISEQGVPLRAKEFDLLALLAQHPGRVYTRSQVLEQVWGHAYEGYDHTVNSHVNRLRTKIESDPRHPRYVLTVWGVGYKFAEHDTAAQVVYA